MQQAPLPPLPPIPELPQDFPVIFAPRGGPPEELIVAVIAILVGGLLLFPLVRAWARRLERGGGDPALKEEVEHLRARLGEVDGLHQRLAELEDRVDFSERMLAQRQAEQIGRPAES